MIIPPLAGICFSGIIGLLLGSFVTMASYRLPRGEELIFRRSHCPLCNHTLGVKDLFPCLSWMMSGGRCRYCHGRIHYRYLLTEIAVALLCMAAYWHAGFTILLPILYGSIVCMSMMAIIDIEYRILPDRLQLVLAGLAFLYRHYTGSSALVILEGAALGLCVGMLLRYGYYAVRRREGLGLGDVKFLVVAGMFLDPFAFVAFLLYSGILGTVIGLVWEVVKKERLFPFGPALCLSLLLCLLAPQWSVVMLYQILGRWIDYL